MFWEIYNRLCADNGLSPNAVAKSLSLSSGSVTAWKNGRIPSNASLKKLSNYFDVSVDYLLGKTDERGSNLLLGELSEKEMHMLGFFRSLSEENQELLIKTLENILKD